MSCTGLIRLDYDDAPLLPQVGDSNPSTLLYYWTTLNLGIPPEPLKLY